MKNYIIYRDDDGTELPPVKCTVEHSRALMGTRRYELHHVQRHSPTGFEIGYNGSGPADLALSILCDHFGEQPTEQQIYHGQYKAAPIYQRFKELFIGSIKDESATITTEQILAFLSGPDIKRRLAAAPTEVNDAELE